MTDRLYETTNGEPKDLADILADEAERLATINEMESIMSKRDKAKSARAKLHTATAELAQARVRLRDAGDDQTANEVEAAREQVAQIRNKIDAKLDPQKG